MADADDITPRRPRLPDAALAPLAGGDAVPLRAFRHAAVLALLADTVREQDVAYLRALADAEPTLRGWDGRVLLIAATDAIRPALVAAAPPFPALLDAGGAVAAAAGATAPALVIADQWGEVHVAASAADDRAWLPVAEVEQWLRFLAVRCAG